MKRFLFILLSLILFPNVVLAESNDCVTGIGESMNYCTGGNCFNSWGYNDWDVGPHSGNACIEVVAVYECKNGKFQSKSFISGYNPNEDYVCSTGSVNAMLVVSKADELEGNDCDATIYVPELWNVSCLGNTSNLGESTSTNNNSSKDNVFTNSEGQITGTTDAKDTGVETYFIVLISLAIVAYIILGISKKKNLFKNI